ENLKAAGRSAHQAVAQAQQYIAEGYGWCVDLDLEKFFDRVNHDKLMGQIAKRVEDKRLLKLILECWGDGERVGQPERGRDSTRRSAFATAQPSRARRIRPGVGAPGTPFCSLRGRQCATSAKGRGGPNVCNCLIDEGRPLGTGWQEQVPNHLRRLWSK